MRLSVREVAAHLGVSENTVFRWVEKEHLPATQVDGQFRFSPAAVYEWATSRGVPISGNLFDESRPLSVLLRLRQRCGRASWCGLRGHDKHSVMTAAVDRLQLPAHVDASGHSRDAPRAGETGVDGGRGGLAIPRVRDPIVLRVQQPQVALFLLEHPIELVLWITSPFTRCFWRSLRRSSRALILLSRLGTVLHDPAVRRRDLLRATPDRIFPAIAEVGAGPPAGRRAQ